jgi:hypothetical protein
MNEITKQVEIDKVVGKENEISVFSPKEKNEMRQYQVEELLLFPSISPRPISRNLFKPLPIM